MIKLEMFHSMEIHNIPYPRSYASMQLFRFVCVSKVENQIYACLRCHGASHWDNNSGYVLGPFHSRHHILRAIAHHA